MGLRDHQGDGTSHLLHLDLGLDLDLDYLHVKASASHRTPPGADAHAASMEPGPPEEAEGQTTTTTAAVVVPTVVQAGMSFCGGSSSGIGSTPADSDESTDSESEQVSTKMRTSFPGLPTHRLAHPQLRRSPCLDLESASPPRDHSDSAPEEAEEEEENAPPTAPAANPMDALRAYQNKMEFALKLGYQEGLIRLVLSKLGPDALINDILGELVKLGSKTDVEQAGLSGNVSLGPGASLIGTPSTIQSRSSSMVPSSSTCSSAGSTTSSSGCGFSDSMESRQSDSPSQMDSLDDKDNLRPIVVDGSNVAMSHGNKEVFSCQGIQLAVDWFLDRGHRDITVFVPAWRKEQSRPDALITDQEILRRLEKDKILVFTPSRRVQGRRVVCYDDRFIVKLAYESDGIIVSNDNYRDLANEKPEWKKFIDERLLMYSFVNDKFMPPDDPLGRHGPSLENFLRKRQIIPEHKKQPCPYGKKCTYGHKCKFYHPERGTQPQRAVADELRASAKICSAVATTTVASKASAESGLVKSHSMPTGGQRQPPCGTDAKRAQAKRQSDPSVRALSYSDVEERLTSRTSPNPRQMETAQAKGVALTLLPAPGGPPMGHTQEPGREYPQSHSLSHSAGLPHSLLPLSSSTSYPTCDSPEPSYTLVRSYSGLRITLPPRSPERRLLPDSLTSDCSSEGSASCGSSSTDSYGGVLGQGGGGGGAGSERSCMSSPDLLLDDTSTGGGGNLRCSHLHLGPLQHHPQPPPLPLSHPHPPSHSRHWGSAQYPSPLPVPHTPPQHRASQSHAFSHHHPHQYLQHQQQSLASYGYSFGYDERPDSPHFSTPARPYMSPQLQHQTIAARSSCPGECPPSAGSSPRPQSSPVGRRLASTRADSVSDSRLYESSPLLPRKALFSTQESLGGWESYYLQPPSVTPTGAPTPPLQQPQPCYEPMRLPGLLESREQVWRGSWSHRSGTHGHQAPPSHGHHHGHHPHSPATTHTPLGSHPPEPPLVSRHQEVRQKVFSNLCNIFPIELVRLVMGRYPQVTDAQQLAAAILAEKNQPGSY